MSRSASPEVSAEEIRPVDLDRAAERLDGVAHRTPVTTSSTVDSRVGALVFFKCENFQRGGAFKFRGAHNAIGQLASSADRVSEGPVITHSSGNHAAAVALAARHYGRRAVVVMPEGAPAPKLEAVAGYGAEIRRCAPTLDAREAAAAKILEEEGGDLVHPFDDPAIIAGQSTVARELLEQVEDLDTILVPVGGGGLASGACLAARRVATATSRPIRVIGVEPAGADDAARSLAAGERVVVVPDTIADGLKATISERTFGILRRHLHDLVTVEEEAIVRAMRFVWERMKIVIEPSAAVPVAALLDGAIRSSLPSARRVGVVLSGGNVDLARLPWSCSSCPSGAQPLESSH